MQFTDDIRWRLSDHSSRRVLPCVCVCVCVCVCDQETPKREARGPSWTISVCKWMNSMKANTETTKLKEEMWGVPEELQ
jgi:hypothetical protein